MNPTIPNRTDAQGQTSNEGKFDRPPPDPDVVSPSILRSPDEVCNRCGSTAFDLACIGENLENSRQQVAKELGRLSGIDEADTQDLYGLDVRNSPLETVYKIAAGITLHGRAFLHWLHFKRDLSDQTISAFISHYCGHYEGVEALRQHQLAQLGVLEDLERLLAAESSEYRQAVITVQINELRDEYYIADAYDGGIYVFHRTSGAPHRRAADMP